MRDIVGEVDALLNQLEPDIRDAFLAAIQRIQSNVKYRELEARIASGDIEGALSLLDLRPEQFSTLRDAVEDAFNRGGDFGPGLTVALSSMPFNRRHFQAESWVRENGAKLIAEVSESTKEGVRQHIEQGIATGRSSAAAARDVTGRVNRATGRREGGILGLTSQQAVFVANARDDLENLNADYFNRQSRDRRFDRTIRKAIREGKKLPKATIDKIIDRYSSNMLSLRGNMIARTEAHQALNAGRYEAMRQNAENAGVSENDIQAVWRAVGDGRTRHTHVSLGGDKVKFGDPFRSPSGAMMKFPGDTSLGASGSEIIGCRCTLTFKVNT